jgi:aminoglycoside 6'-N-acetyltransferase I
MIIEKIKEKEINVVKDNLASVEIRKLQSIETVPYELLLLADPSKEHINKYIRSSETYIAWLKKKAIGVYVLHTAGMVAIEIKNIAIDEKFRNKGLVELLLDDATKRAKEKGYEEIEIGTSNASFSQLAIYQKNGFEIAGLKKNYFQKTYKNPIFENEIQCKHMIMLKKIL